MPAFDPSSTAAPDAGAPLTPGALVGGTYRVLQPLAEGGMASLYRVEHRVTKAHLALKVLRVHLSQDEDFARRLLAEARVGARIRSHHVAQVIDAGLDPERKLPFIVLELLEGVSLSRELRLRGRFAPAETREILRQICHALAAAHDEGIVHLDLKPRNLFLARAGVAGQSHLVKVLDFGIARVLAGHHPDLRAKQLGTPAWMAPEQVEGASSVSPRTDLWALGLLAYTLLTGRWYWRASRNEVDGFTSTVLREVQFEPLVAATERAREQGVEPLLPAEFDAWFRRCVVRAPERRFADARVAFSALAELIPARAGEPPVELCPTEIPTFPRFGATPTTPTRVLGSPAPPSSAAELAADASRRSPRGLGATAAAATALVLAGGLGVGVLATREPPQPLPERGAASAVGAHAETAAPVLLHLRGSRTLGVELMPALAAAYLRQRLGDAVVIRQVEGQRLRVEARANDDDTLEAIEIEAKGSAAAFVEPRSPERYVGMASRPITSEEAAELSRGGAPSAAASEHPVALDGIAVIVNPRNPLGELERTQVARLFAGEVARWSELGGADAPIELCVPDERSGTLETFRQLLLGGGALSPQATRFADAAALSAAVGTRPHAVGFVGLPHIRATKPVMIRDGAGLPLLPGPTSIATEDYPLARRLYLYLPPQANAAARGFVDFALSDAGQALVEASGFIDLRPECDPRAAACPDCSPTHRRLVRDACRLTVSLRFDRQGEELDSRALGDLRRAALAVTRPPLVDRAVLLVGFAAITADPEASRRRSQRLAERVATQLLARGVSVTEVVGLGAERPLVANDSPDAPLRNQRVELWLR